MISISRDTLLLLSSVLEDSEGNVITLGQGSPPYPMYLQPIVEASWTSAAYYPKSLVQSGQSFLQSAQDSFFWTSSVPMGPSSIHRLL